MPNFFEDLFQQGPSPGEKFSQFYEKAYALPPEHRNFITIMRIAQELGSSDPATRAQDFFKTEKGERDRLEAMLPEIQGQATRKFLEQLPEFAPRFDPSRPSVPISPEELTAMVSSVGGLPSEQSGRFLESSRLQDLGKRLPVTAPLEGFENLPPAVRDPLALGKLKETFLPGTAGEFAPQVSPRYLPVGEDKYQLEILDEVKGTTSPVLRQGKPVILTEKQILTAEGKKAQSIIDPFETRFLTKLGESEAVRLTELKKTALDAVNSKRVLAEGLRLVNQGIYTGSAANIKLSFDKWLQEAGINVGGRKATNTDTFASLMGLQVGKIIKAFGSGTGLSDADREYAEKIAGGRITLTGDAIRKLIDINNRLADFAIFEYNSQTERAKQQVNEKDYLQPIEVPQFNIPPNPTAPSGGQSVSPGQGELKIKSIRKK